MTEMNEHLEELFPFYALGALTPAERAEVEAYIAANPDARVRLEDMSRASSALSYNVDPIAPPPQLKQTLMSRVKTNLESRRPSFDLIHFLASLWPKPLAPLSPAFAVLSLILLIAVGAWAFSLNAEVTRLRAETADLRRELIAQRQIIAQIADPGAGVMDIAGTDRQPNAHGQFITQASGQTAVLVVNGLAPLERGKTYQFWLIRGGTPVSAGLFEVDEDGQAVLQVTADVSPGSFSAIGVSIEPAGGSSLPTGDIVMLGSIS